MPPKLLNIEAMTINGAVGDALGAGYEILTGDALPKYDPPLSFIQSANGEPGSVTDDTGMTIAGMVGIERTLKKLTAQSAGKALDVAVFLPELLQQTHFAYMQWAAHQKAHAGYQAEAVPAYLEKFDAPTDTLTPFLHTKGPGPGTLKALNKVATGESALGHAPKHFAPGCGGMMRVAPFACLSVMSKGAIDAFTVGVQTAELTHPLPAESSIASGIVCALVARGLSDGKTSMAATLHTLKEEYLSPSNNDDAELRRSKHYTRLAIEAAEEVAMKPYAPESANEAALLFFERARAIDSQHTLYGEEARLNFFHALPVLTHTVFVLLSQEKHRWSADDTLAAAVLHDGDSDSVGAIVGNVLGARTGEQSARFNELQHEYQQGITAAAQSFSTSLQQSALLLANLRARTSLAM